MSPSEKKKRKKKKCWCHTEYIASCGDCAEGKIQLNWQEAQDCISAICYWLDCYEYDWKKAPQTQKALEKLTNKLWKLKSGK